MKLSLRAQISLAVAVIIMLVFFGVQTALVAGYFEVNYDFVLFGWISVVAFMPFFFLVVIEFIRKVRYKFQSIDDTLQAINSSNALVELDVDGTIITANKIFCNLVGYTQQELTGMKHSNLFFSEDVNSYSYNRFLSELQRGKPQIGDFRRKTKDGKEVWIYGAYNPIKDPYGKTYRILKIASDVTAKKLVEQEIAKKNTYLEHAAKILRHDMHSGINTYIPRGLSSLKRRLTDEQERDLKIQAPIKMIKEGLEHTQKVYKGVKEFTNLVKKDAHLDTQVVDLKDILRGYFKNTSYIKQIVIDELVECQVNEALFCTAVDNLVRNGLRYNDSSNKMVHIFMESPDVLCIQDNGRGMSQEEFLELSKPYVRKEDQKEGGTGLGLNICIAIMQEHNFKITSEKLEQGTKLRIKLK